MILTPMAPGDQNIGLTWRRGLQPLAVRNRWNKRGDSQGKRVIAARFGAQSKR